MRELVAPSALHYSGWDQLFTERRIELQLPEGGPQILRIGQIAVTRTGNLFVADSRGKRILEFTPDGRLKAQIKSGDGVKFSIIGAIALDPDDNLVVYDVDSSWVTTFAPPEYRPSRRFRVAASVADLVALRGGGLVTYYPADEDGAFRKFDDAGDGLAATHPIRNQQLRIFHGRVQNGGVARDASGDLFGIVPSTFELVHLSPDLKVRELLRGSASDQWTPSAAAWPVGLNAFDYRAPHERWWNSFTHIGRPYALAPALLLVTLFKSDGLRQTEDFGNLYRTDGRVVVEGLRIPHEGQVVGAADGKVYVVRNAHLGSGKGGDVLAPLELYEYRLRSSL